MFTTKQFNAIILEVVVDRFSFCLFFTKCMCIVLDSFSYWYWPAALLAINPPPKQKGSCEICSPLCRQGGSCLVLFFSLSLSLFLCLFTLPPTVCSHFIKSEGNNTGSHCWGSTPIRRLLSSQISHVLAFKCRKFTPDFSELCPEVWRVHQTGKEKVFLSIPSSQPLLKNTFFSLFILYQTKLLLAKLQRISQCWSQGVMECLLKEPAQVMSVHNAHKVNEMLCYKYSTALNFFKKCLIFLSLQTTIDIS